MNYQPIIELVKQAGEIVFDPTLTGEVTMKGRADFLTAVDLGISARIKEGLAALCPDCGFVSEEDTAPLSDRCFILDPIDGTTNLVYDYRMSSVSLAYLEEGRVMFGIIYNPYNGDTFIAERGHGVTLNGRPLAQAPDRAPADSLIEFGAGSTKKQFAEETFSLAKEVFCECLDLRRICSSALAIAYIAAGRLNGYFEKVLKPWDYAAAVLMLEECGCVATDYEGNPVPYDTPSSFVAGTPRTHAFLLEKIRKHIR